jgi:two-component system sensor histidine kinase BaeS
MSWLAASSIRLPIVLACVAVALVTIAIVGVGVWLVGGDTFAALMQTHGQDAADAHAMFDDSVTRILLIAIAVAIVVAVLLAGFLASRIGRPLQRANRGAQSIADGDYGARLPREGSAELISLAESFNEMAAALDEHDRMQREFIANAAHELRTPLTNLQGYLEALRDGVIPPERQVFESLGEEVDRLVRLSRSLDDLARGEASRAPADLQEVDVAAAVRSAVELSRPAAQARQLDLVIEDGEANTRAAADRDALSQVLANLLDNAVAYTPEGGRITVRCAQRPRDVLVSIDNTGDGIPAADLPHVFERFYRVEKSRDRRTGGAGIGLAIVRHLVESAGGQVGVESTDRLTTFWFTLPGSRVAVPATLEPAPR